MDKEKLNKAAEEYQENSNVMTENFYPSDIEDAFMAGADWIMQQPLSDRLTDEEKEKIMQIYSRAVEHYNGFNEDLYSVATVVIEVMKDIFGADLFNPNQPTAI